MTQILNNEINNIPVATFVELYDVLNSVCKENQIVIFKTKTGWQTYPPRLDYDFTGLLNKCYSNFRIEKVCDLCNFKLIYNLNHLGVVEILDDKESEQ